MAKLTDPRIEFASGIAAITADYEPGGGVMSTDRVMAWIEQFPQEHHVAVLSEMEHILRSCYVSKERMAQFLDGLAVNPGLTKKDPGKFWSKTYFLNIQQRGASQKDMVELLQANLDARDLSTLDESDQDTESFIYLDDVICTGNHLYRDLSAWIPTAPQKCTVNIITAFIHTGGAYRALEKAKDTLKTAAKTAGKEITFECWAIPPNVEDRRYYTNTSDVFRPKAPPDDERVVAYLKELEPEIEAARAKFGAAVGLTWRAGDHIGKRKTFSSGRARALIEDQLLIAGCEVRSRCKHLGQSARPLGYQFLTTLGFGCTVVTYRNCPNNCPLAWWAGDPWFPLFPRRTNTETAIAHIFD
ncbi:hypothetical protein DB347_07065 [Opitutaceae bacterium EW11]|nr:hypothetical protein DB347_07065 [Opitutaceae bacterium EW11]